MSNIKNFLESGEQTPIVYNIWGRTSAKGNPTYLVQLMQPLSRTSNVSDRTSLLLSATQGSLAPRKLTHPMNVAESQINRLMKGAGLPEISDEVKAQVRDTGNLVSIFSAVEEDTVIKLNETGFFGEVEVGIELTESPYNNPYTPSQDVIRNPTTGEAVNYTTPAGESAPYYAHTDIAEVSEVSHQFIADYYANSDARDYPASVSASITKEATKTTSVAAGEITVTQ